ncbi:hypothetical protein, partial [Ruminococcus sp.]|uniref:hypothetical protein n=1 Tax=Ruminococcus sp. TaxID=41978 RepID=UPI003AB7CB9D
GKHFNERKHWLNDDYVKFIRYAQSLIERTGSGILAYICPHGFLDNPTFRAMRWNLLQTFDKIYVLNLHGNINRGEKCPDGSKDENVFDIEQGVSINIYNQKSYLILHGKRLMRIVHTTYLFQIQSAKPTIIGNG